MPKLTETRRIELRVLREYMKRMGGVLLGASGYPNTLKAARKSGIRSPQGVLLHAPRDTWEVAHGIPEMKGQQVPCAALRVYVLWFEEPHEQVIETMEWLREWFPRHERCVINLQGEST